MTEFHVYILIVRISALVLSAYAFYLTFRETTRLRHQMSRRGLLLMQALGGALVGFLYGQIEILYLEFVKDTSVPMGPRSLISHIISIWVIYAFKFLPHAFAYEEEEEGRGGRD